MEIRIYNNNLHQPETADLMSVLEELVDLLGAEPDADSLQEKKIG